MSMDAQILAMISQAETAEGFGDFAKANAIWSEIKLHAPNHPRLLVRDAMEDLKSGRVDAAFDLLTKARLQAPNEASIPLHLGLVHKLKGRLPLAIEEIDNALAIDPYLFMGLLWKGAVLEQMGKRVAAANVYANAMKTVPDESKIAPQMRAAVEHAKRVIAQNASSKQKFLRERTQSVREKYSAKELKRAEECIDILSGVSKHYVHDGILFNFPQLPAIQFYERELFPWLEELEAATPIIQEEAANIIRHNWEKFAPYVQTPKDKPTNQWEYLNFNPEWSTVHFYRDGKKFDDVHALCPRTSEILSRLPLAYQANFGPTVVFSVLQPHTHIPPHTGSTNIRLLCHLPLKIPPKCWFRVGNETREWKIGEAFVFDDSIDHEAMNDSDETRYIMILDVWNPFLSMAEREIINAMLFANNEFASQQ